jgi:hypothetical protein
VEPDSLAVVDPKTNEIVRQVRIPGRPSLVAAARGLIWVASDASRTISSIPADKGAVRHVVAPNATPNALAAAADAVWVLDGDRRVLLKVDPTYGAVTRRIALPRAPPSPVTSRRPRFQPELEQSECLLRRRGALGDGRVDTPAARRP